MVKNHTKTLILLFHFVIFLSLVFTLIQSGFFYFSHSIATWLLIFFLSLLLIINTLIINTLIIGVYHLNLTQRRDYFETQKENLSRSPLFLDDWNF